MLPELILRFSTQTGDKLRSSRGTGMGATASYKWFMRAGPGDHCLSSFFMEITVCKVLWKICYPSISYRSLVVIAVPFQNAEGSCFFSEELIQPRDQIGKGREERMQPVSWESRGWRTYGLFVVIYFTWQTSLFVLDAAFCFVAFIILHWTLSK